MASKKNSKSSKNQESKPKKAKVKPSKETVPPKRSDDEFIIVHRQASALSHWWRTLQIFSFFIIFLSGVIVCITLGRISNAFGDTCILYGDMYFLEGTNLSDIHSRDLVLDHIGLARECYFCQFSPMAGACFAGILGAIFMQCGSGHEENLTLRTVDQSWMIVIPAIPFALVFFIMSLVSLVNIVEGLSYFCNNVVARSHPSLNITSCTDVFSLTYPFRPAYAPPEYQPQTDVYLNFITSQIGASLHFIGWFLALSILLVRCSTHADFQVGVIPGKSNNASKPTPKRPVKKKGYYTLIPETGDSNDEESTKFSTSSNSDSDTDTVFYESQEYSQSSTKPIFSTRNEKIKMRNLQS